MWVLAVDPVEVAFAGVGEELHVADYGSVAAVVVHVAVVVAVHVVVVVDVVGGVVAAVVGVVVEVVLDDVAVGDVEFHVVAINRVIDALAESVVDAELDEVVQYKMW